MNGTNATSSMDDDFGGGEHCCARSESDYQLIADFNFWVEGVVAFAAGLFGLFGNTLSISVLRRRDMRNAFNSLLVLLATVDSFLICFAIFDHSIIRAWKVDAGRLYKYAFPWLLYPAQNIVLTASAFLTLSIAAERYLAVCHPLAHRNASTTQTATTRVMKLALPAFVAAAVINVPKFLETELVWPNRTTADKDNSTGSRGDDDGGLFSFLPPVEMQVTDLRKDPNYIIYYLNWFGLFSTGILPMGLLIFLNVNIYIKVLETRRNRLKKKALAATNRRHLLPPEPSVAAGDGNSNNGSFRNNSSPMVLNSAQAAKQLMKQERQQQVSFKEIKMAVVLLAIVLIFLICHLPRVMLNLHEFFMVSTMIRCGLSQFCPPTWFMCAISVSHLLLIVNSSVNILVYCSIGEKFRKGLRDRLRLERLPRFIHFFSSTEDDEHNLSMAYERGRTGGSRRHRQHSNNGGGDNNNDALRLEPRREQHSEDGCTTRLVVAAPNKSGANGAAVQTRGAVAVATVKADGEKLMSAESPEEGEKGSN